MGKYLVPLAAATLLAVSCMSPSASGPTGTPTSRAIAAIPSLEVSVPASFGLTTSTASRALTGSAFDPSATPAIRSDGWLALKKELSSADGPDIKGVLKKFQAYVEGLASVASGQTYSLKGLGTATFTSTSTSGGGDETVIAWTLPQRVSAATMAKNAQVTWPTNLNPDNSLTLTDHVYIDVVTDAGGSLVNFTLQIVSVETDTATGFPLIRVSATRSAGNYELYQSYWGNYKYESSAVNGSTVSFVKEINRPYPQGLQNDGVHYDWPNGRQFYFYGTGDGTEGAVTWVDYNPKYATASFVPGTDAPVQMHREVFNSNGDLLFKQNGATDFTNTKLFTDFGTNGYNLNNLGLPLGNANASSSLQTGPARLTITYSIDSNGQITGITDIRTGAVTVDGNGNPTGGTQLANHTATFATPLPEAKFYDKVGADWASGDALYYPQRVLGASASPVTVTQVFNRGYTVPTTAKVANQAFYISNNYPMKYLTLSANTDQDGVEYNNTATPYAFYNWLGTPVNNIVWYGLDDVRHNDGTYIPKSYWVSKQPPASGSVTYNAAAGDLRIGGVWMAKAYGVDSTGTATLDYVPMVWTTNIPGDTTGGVTYSGLYGELMPALTYTHTTDATTFLANLEAKETGGVFQVGTFNAVTFQGAFPALPTGVVFP